MEGVIAGEAGRSREVMGVTMPLADLRTSAREGAETLAKGSVEEDWQGMVIPDPAYYFRDSGERESR